MFSSSRAVFLLGTLFAIVGTAEATLSTCTGAANNVYRAENNPGGSGVIACKCVAGYASDANGIVLGDVTLSCTRCAPGYYFSAGDGTVAGAVCTKASADTYWAGLYDFATNNADSNKETVNTACPTNSESVAGSTALADCKVKAGYYISTKATSTSDATSLVISAATANSYGAGGDDAGTQVANDAATLTACPFGGTSAAGSSALTDCTPDCVTTNANSNAVAIAGTCRCATTHYGAPLDAGGATTAAATSTGCTACPTGKFMQTAYTAIDAGAGTSADCVVQPGFIIDTASAGDVTGVAVDQVGKDQYSAAVASNAGAPTSATACPYAGTTVQPGNSLADCTPSCGSGINTVAIGGTCRCATTHYGTPQDAAGATTAAATQGCTACPANSETAYTTASPSGTLADCKVKAGYYIATKSDADDDATGLVIEAAPAGAYAPGGADAGEQAAGTVTATLVACVVKSSSEASSDEISDCKVSPGFFLSVASPSASSSGRIAKSAADYYAAGGTSISSTSAETSTTCPYAGTSPIGSTTLSGCTPTSCGTVAVASSGTCVCKAGRTGTPTPTNAAVTGGCTAITCVANKYVSSNACTDCTAGKTNEAGDDASGADTTCDTTLCAADEYVSSNACTACAAGSTNTAGDDASAADTTCDVVSGASHSVVKATTMISFLVFGFLALAM